MSNTVGKSITRTFAAALIMALVGLTSVTADAQMRMVIVNGQVLMPQELALLDQLSGGYVPNGAYWLNMQTGVWGYAGDPAPRGRIGGDAATDLKSLLALKSRCCFNRRLSEPLSASTSPF